MFAGRMFAGSLIQQFAAEFGPGTLGFIAHGVDGVSDRDTVGRIDKNTQPILRKPGRGHIERPDTGIISP